MPRVSPIVPESEATHPTPTNRESSPIFPSLTLLRSPTIRVPRASVLALRRVTRQYRSRRGPRPCEGQSICPKDRPHDVHRYPPGLTAYVKCAYEMRPCRLLSKPLPVAKAKQFSMSGRCASAHKRKVVAHLAGREVCPDRLLLNGRCVPTHRQPRLRVFKCSLWATRWRNQAQLGHEA